MKLLYILVVSFLLFCSCGTTRVTVQDGSADVSTQTTQTTTVTVQRGQQ